MIGDGLPDPGEGKRYELWMIDGSGAYAMHLLDPAEDGDVQRVMEISGTPAGWGVTIESEQGSDMPTEPVLYHAEVDKRGARHPVGSPELVAPTGCPALARANRPVPGDRAD